MTDKKIVILGLDQVGITSFILRFIQNIYTEDYSLEPTTEEESKPFEVITYIDEVAFNYTLPDEEEPRTLEHELTFVWEDTLEKFVEEYGAKKPYKIRSFRREREQKFFTDQIESETEDLIDEVQEVIANKMKFGFDFSGQLHNDD